jgi:hypothetical protein
LGVSSIKYIFSVFARDLREDHGRFYEYEYDLLIVMGICLKRKKLNHDKKRKVKNHGLLQELESFQPQVCLRKSTTRCLKKV